MCLSEWNSDLPQAMKRASLRQAVHHLRRNLRDISFAHIENAIAIPIPGNRYPAGITCAKNKGNIGITFAVCVSQVKSRCFRIVQPNGVDAITIPIPGNRYPSGITPRSAGTGR